MRKSTIQILTEIESKFDVEQWLVNGAPIWPFLRIKIGHKLESRGFSEKRDKVVRIKQLVYRILKSLLSYKKISGILNDCEVLIINDGSGYYITNGIIRNRHYNLILCAHSELNKEKIRAIDYAEPASKKFLANKTTIAAWLDKQYLKSLVMTYFYREIKSENFEEQYEGFLKYSKQEEFFDKDLLLKNVLNNVKRWSFVSKEIEKLFCSLSRLKICYITTYYGFYGLALTAALKRIGVRVIDLQHGLQGNSHYAYSSWKLNKKSEYIQLPNYFIVWTEADRRSLIRWITAENVFVIGTPVDNNEGSEIEYNNNNGNQKTILYSCSHISIEKQFGLLKNISSLNLENVKFLVRVHPTELSKLYEFDAYLREISLKNYELFKSSNDLLTSVINAADAHITINSSVAIEINSFGKKSILPRVPAYSVLHEYDVGLFEYFSSQAELYACINKICFENNIITINNNQSRQTLDRAKDIVSKLLSL